LKCKVPPLQLSVYRSGHIDTVGVYNPGSPAPEVTSSNFTVSFAFESAGCDPFEPRCYRLEEENKVYIDLLEFTGTEITCNADKFAYIYVENVATAPPVDDPDPEPTPEEPTPTPTTPSDDDDDDDSSDVVFAYIPLLEFLIFALIAGGVGVFLHMYLNKEWLFAERSFHTSSQKRR
jgi:hypothetical protein